MKKVKETKIKTYITNEATLSDIQSLRKSARKNIEEGAVTLGYTANRKAVIKLLNEALAVEEEHAEDLASLLGGIKT
jgi:bacterioferritin (cytochrome b1)